MREEVTFIIPIGIPHKAVSERAIASVNEQTIPVKLLTLLDVQQKGPGTLRNQMFKQVDTEFVCFLDSDDWIEPTFAEACIAEYRSIGGGKYIYTDWIDSKGYFVQTPCLTGPNGHPIPAPGKKPYCGGTWHPITVLLPTEWVRAVGGFDEKLPALEDSDFFLKLCTSNHCGHRLAKPLFHYSPNGGRALRFNQTGNVPKLMAELTARYGGRMGCCGDDEREQKPIGQRQAGDVQARMRWRGNRKEHGTVTSRIYPRGSFPMVTWVDPRDAADQPDLWQVINVPVDHMTGIDSLEQLAEMSMATVARSRFPDPVPAKTAPVEIKPDIKRVVNLARQAWNKEPVFVWPIKDYPSYCDIKKLVEVSGFQSITLNQIDANSRSPYIIVTPEPIPNFRTVSRVICWQLEYAGDYTHNYDEFTGEVWASDRAWAEQNGKKFVLMGSHEGLVGPRIKQMDWDYDVTMLSYMIPRRQTMKDQLSDLRWPEDYPGHSTPRRNDVLWTTKTMLHVHQHEGQAWSAPQRIALAAAYSMPMVSETTFDLVEFRQYILMADYANIPEAVRSALNRPEDGRALHEYLCTERTFRRCVEEALKA